MNQSKPKPGKKTMKMPKEKAKCPLCDYTAVQGYRMKRHMRIHTGEKPFMCAMCDQSFTQKSSLKEHLWKHTAMRSCHKCPHCDAIFNQQQDVKAHIANMHTACQQMLCTICSGIFTDRYSLLQHQKSHDNMFRYQCLECAFSSRDKTKLIIHMSVHTKKKPLRCNACKTIFKHKHRLLNHLFQKHDVNTFGDDFSATPAQANTPSAEVVHKKLTNQQELEEQYQIMDEHGNTLQLSEADAEAIQNAMQQSTSEGTLQIIQNEEGTMTVTVVTVAQSFDGAIQSVEEDIEAMAVGQPIAQQLAVSGEGLVEGGTSQEGMMAETTENHAGELATGDNTKQVECAHEDIPSTSLA